MYWSESSISIAWVEARKGKYIVFETKIAQVLDRYFWISLKDKSIKYWADIDKNILNKISKIVFLYDPTPNSPIDEECKIENKSVYEYFHKNKKQVLIHPITDPHGIDDKKKQLEIIHSIDSLVKSL